MKEVDGTPVDIDRALAGATGNDLDRRLAELEETTERAAPLPGIDGARREAERILNSGRFKPSEPPRPFKGLIRRLGEWLEPLLGPLAPAGRLLTDLFGNTMAVAALGAFVVALAAIVTLRLTQRRARVRLAPHAGGIGDIGHTDPRQLERDADAAEAAGDFERAFRLRFLAGILRLDQAGALRFKPWQTTGELVREVHSPTFRDLATAFDEIAYGGRAPAAADLDHAKRDWPRVLEEARR